MIRLLRRGYRRVRAPAGVLAQAVRWRFLDWMEIHLLKSSADRRLIRQLAVTRPNTGSTASRRIYVDVSVISQHDAGTGIQRVVRSIRDRLPQAIGNDADVEFLVAGNARDTYATSRGQPLRGAPGTLFFGLDFATDAVYRSRNELRDFKQAGGQIWFLLHDILPLSHPQWFTPSSRLRYRRWLRVCAALADGFLCVSPEVAAQLQRLLVERYELSRVPRIATIDLGADIMTANPAPTESKLPKAEGLDQAVFQRAVLVVGTLEPRKGHADLLDAFDLLWRQGHDLPLVFIGRPGWNTEPLQRRIKGHARFGDLLFWLDGVDDQGLHAAYRHCRLVAVPSLAEGFGLPFSEALASGAPVLARDIPVFRRRAGAGIDYFREQASAPEIAAIMLRAYADADRPRKRPPLRRWEDTAEQVVAELLRPPVIAGPSDDPTARIAPNEPPLTVRPCRARPFGLQLK